MYDPRRFLPRISLVLALLLVGLIGCSGDGVSGAQGDENLKDLFPNRVVWTPALGTTWQWQLTGAIDTSVDVAVYDVDLFDTPKSTVDALKAQGRTVIAYFSAGSFESWRPDAQDFDGAAIGDELEGFADERWLDVRSPTLRSIMEARLDLAVAKGFDAVEPDNVDGYVNDTGFDLTERDQLVFLYFLANEAHERGLSVGLKNALSLVETTEPLFDWALNEQCLESEECDMLRPFLDAEKAVFHVEYVDSCDDLASEAANICDDASIAGFSTLVKTLALPACRTACDAVKPVEPAKTRRGPFRIRSSSG